MKALDLINLIEGIDLVSDTQDVVAVIVKEFARQKIKQKIKRVDLPDEKKVIFNHSSGGGNITIESKGTKVLMDDGSTITGSFNIYITFRNETFTINYNFLQNRE